MSEHKRIVRGSRLTEVSNRLDDGVDKLQEQVGHWVVWRTTPANPFRPHKRALEEFRFILEGEAIVTQGSGLCRRPGRPDLPPRLGGARPAHRDGGASDLHGYGPQGLKGCSPTADPWVSWGADGTPSRGPRLTRMDGQATIGPIVHYSYAGGRTEWVDPSR